MNSQHIRALLWMPDFGGIPGGHKVQLEMTAQALRELGVSAEVSTDLAAEPAEFDIVHGFGLKCEQIRRCRAAGVPVALSTIYWSVDYTHPQTPLGVRVRFGLALLRSALKGQYRDKCRVMTQALNEQRTAFEMADILLPNSQGEADCVAREVGVTTPMHVVPNAVDDVMFGLPAEGASRPIDVLFRGRFEPHKNQLEFIRAMRQTKWRTVVAGPAHPHHPRYYEQCKREATGNVSIAPAVPVEEMPTLYQQAKVHILPSWFETTGLVSLEAALCGCKIVTTDRGFARDYFGDLAWYCDPSSASSIRSAVDAAMRSPANDELRVKVQTHYTWRQTARATLAGYQSVLNSRSNAPSEVLTRIG